MKELSANQVQQIQQELASEGVEMMALLDDLVDHLCTSIEEEMSEGIDFETAYARSRERLLSGSAREIQDATTLLINSQYLFIMRKIMFFSTFAWLFLWLTSVLFGMLQLPAGGQLSMISGIVLGAISLPSYILYRRQLAGEKSLLERLSMYAAAPTGIFMTLACAFKLMHWPGANVLLLCGLISLTCVFLPLFFLFYYQQDPKTQTI